MSRKAFSEYIGMKGCQLYCIEKEMLHYINAEPITRLSEIFGISVDEILSEDLEEKYRETRFLYRK